MKKNQNINLNWFNSNNSTVAIFSYSIINTIAKNIFSHKNIMTNIFAGMFNDGVNNETFTI